MDSNQRPTDYEMYFPKGRHADSITYIRNTSPDSGRRVVVWRLTDNGCGNMPAGVSGAASSISAMSSDMGDVVATLPASTWVFIFDGPQATQTRHIGNAVPPLLLLLTLRRVALGHQSWHARPEHAPPGLFPPRGDSRVALFLDNQRLGPIHCAYPLVAGPQVPKHEKCV